MVQNKYDFKDDGTPVRDEDLYNYASGEEQPVSIGEEQMFWILIILGLALLFALTYPLIFK